MEAAVAGLLGVLLGGVITSFFQYYFGFQAKIKESEFLYKEVRYKAITIFMYCLVYSDTSSIRRIRPDLKNLEDIKDEIKIEFVNSLLFASDDVIKSLQIFLKDTSEKNLMNAILSIRKDLWGRTTKLENISLLSD